MSPTSAETATGHSAERTQVTFAGAGELASRAPRLSVSPWEVYALVWFGEDQVVAILEFDDVGFFRGDTEFTDADFIDMFQIGGDADFKQVNGEQIAK